MNDFSLYLRAVRLDEACGGALADEDCFALRLPAVQALREELQFAGPVTFLCGENGTGKSTRLEALAVAAGFNPEGGSRNFHFSTADTHTGLHRFLRLRRGPRREKDGYILRAESFYNVATEIQRLDAIPAAGRPVLDSYGGRSLHAQSHGESFLALVLNRFGGQGLYLLDEPEAALSASRQLTLLAALHGLCQQGSQFIIATHSPILLAYPGADILVLSDQGLARAPYKDTMPYQVTKAFLDDPARMLDALLAPM